MHEELLGLSTHELLQVLLHREEARYIGVRGGDRHEWLTAEQAIENDLRALATGQPDAAPPAIPEAATAVPKAEVKEGFLAMLLEELDALSSEDRSARLGLTHSLPVQHGKLDPSALRELVDAWTYALRYEDTSGNDGELPEEAEELVALHRKYQAGRAPVAEDNDYARMLRERGEVSLRAYGIRETFAVGDWIAHPKFGEGVVLEAHTKIVVQFADHRRTLVHAR
ncbi:MAG: hypothetical protein AB8I08_19075 [Sandaracinaceae bacterium]